MLKLPLILLTILTSISFSFSQFEVAKGEYPFNKIVEWPGQGSILLAEDPTGSKKEIFINFFNNEGETQWSKSIYPKTESSKLIVSGKSEYFYFVDNFEHENNFIYYAQLNQSGGVVSTKIDLLKVIREYGYNVTDDIEITEVVNTPKSIVFYLQLPVKGEGIIENIFVSITHHNNRLYHTKGPSTDMKLQKKGITGPILFAGADESTINFAYASNEESKTDVNFIAFSPKAEPIADQFMKIGSANGIVSQVKSLNLDGSNYVEDKSKFNARGKAIYYNKQYYYVMNDAQSNCLKIYGLNSARKVEQLNECSGRPVEARNPNASISYFELDGELYVSSEIDGSFSAYKIQKDGVSTLSISKKDLEKVQLNPSSFKIKDNTANFVHLIKGTPYFTDSKNMEKQEKIIFKK
ncbi:hypothetical protein [Brumimicrobium mesophilum]|uniref:hypothetical protein n=1 Tax=Brumimicrobium mesophilum TaxID=392717 RepID=UPI000D13FEB6|nr:hypothetical protein [Brumimicrobium mesophilum]